MELRVEQAMPAEVAEAFRAIPTKARAPMLAARTRVLEVAAADTRIGPLAEMLRWGEPSYRPRRSGTTVRLGWSPKRPDQWGVYVSCQTTLVEGFRAQHGDRFRYAGNRGLIFLLGEQPPEALDAFLADALTYRLR